MTHIKMLLIPADGSAPSVVVVNGWQSQAKAIGAQYVERVRVAEEWAMSVDESGRYSPTAALNLRASILYGTPTHGQPIVGDALLGREGWVEAGMDSGIDWVDVDEAEMLAWFETTMAERRP